ncbi:hypothetical protein MHI37_14925 [Paenibacillus sp. FSL H8-0548]|nr:hypothetical protein [Paenibacillus sp. FSL H8-0548]
MRETTNAVTHASLANTARPVTASGHFFERTTHAMHTFGVDRFKEGNA